MPQQGPGNAETLLLSAADVGAALFNACVVAVGHLADELVGAGQLAGVAALFRRGVGLAPTQVVENGAAEQRVLLQHHADGTAQRREVVAADVAPAHQYLTLCRVIQTVDEADERRLAAARAADDADGLAALNAERDIEEGATLVKPTPTPPDGRGLMCIFSSILIKSFPCV